MSLEIEFPAGQRVQIIPTLQQAVKTGELFSVPQLKEIQQKMLQTLVQQAEFDYQTLQLLLGVRDKYSHKPRTSAQAFTEEQFMQPYERCLVDALDPSSSQRDLLRFFHQKLLQVGLLGVRSRQERLLIARNIIADLELCDAL